MSQENGVDGSLTPSRWASRWAIVERVAIRAFVAYWAVFSIAVSARFLSALFSKEVKWELVASIAEKSLWPALALVVVLAGGSRVLHILKTRNIKVGEHQLTSGDFAAQERGEGELPAQERGEGELPATKSTPREEGNV